MKFSWHACLLAASAVRGQYFSEGWKPGQQRAAPTAVPIQVDSTFESSGDAEFVAPKQPATEGTPDLLGLLDVNTYLTSEPAQALFQRFGVNITERIAAAQVSPWDDRIPLITDDNYEDMIVNEPLSDEEAADRVWAICITAATGRQDGLSKFVDEAFDDAYNRTLLADDMPNVRWGRIDYFNVTYLTTKWVVWQAPYVLILKDRGQSLRFYRPQNLRLRDAALRDFLLADGWQVTTPWNTAYAPGGEREYIMEFFATWMTKIYNLVIRIPKFILLIVSGTVASFLIGFMHKKSPQAKKPAVKAPTTTPAVATVPAASSTSAVASPASPGSSKSSKRKGKK
ncbi:hypothetical protein BDZ89DRAFT_1062344 [Hymenopellis radicata]|nr:hypothetical protein BDZ89DRAFT_1062344 [Hymenopellis radicata]